MNIYCPQSYEAVAELMLLSSTEALLKSGQSSRLLLCITQDALTAGYIFTAGEYKSINGVKTFIDKVCIDKDTWNDAVSSVDEWSLGYIMNKMNHIREVLEWKGFTQKETERFIYTGHGLMSMLLPDDFEYTFVDEKNNNYITIVRGVMMKGTLGKQTLGDSHSSIVHKLEKEYGAKITIDFVSYYQWVVNHCLKCRGFSIGIEDCMPTRMKDVKNEITKSFMEAQIIESSESDPDIRERKINTTLGNATTIGQKISKDELQFDNSLNVMVVAGSKGSYVNIAQIRSLLGQQNVEGKRMPTTFGGRTLPHYTKSQGLLPSDATVEEGEHERRLLYESGGFVIHNYIEGLNPQEFFFHAEGGREGVIDTAIKSVTKETTIIFIENEEPKYMEIGVWIDELMKNSEKIVYGQNQNLETLELIDQTYIPTTDEYGNVTWKKITHVTRHDPSINLYKIETDSGRKVIVAESKSLLIWDEDISEFIEKYTPDINIGDYAPTTSNLNDFVIVKNCIDMINYFPKTEYLYGTDFHIAEHEIELINERKISGWWKKNNGSTFILPYTSKGKFVRVLTRSKVEDIQDGYIYPFMSNRKNRLPEKFMLDRENGIFIGLYLAEGSNDGHGITITNNDETIRTFVRNWFSKMGIHYDEEQRINTIGGLTSTVRGHSTLLVNFLDKLVGKGAQNKFVPVESFTAPTEFVTGLLNGYFSGDGCVSKNEVVIGSASYKLIEGISFLCSTLGIFGKLTTSIGKKNNLGTKKILPSYRLSIRSLWVKIFSEKITFIDTIKNEKLKNIKPTKNHRNFKVVNDVVLDKIIKIEKISNDGHPKLYDLTIPSTLNFCLANGLQVRDTAHSGYIQRKLVKKMEDLVKSYSSGLVVNSKNIVVQFNYGQNFDPARLVRTQTGMSFINIRNVADCLNTENDWEEWKLNKQESSMSRIEVM